ncbi:trigger factor [Pseudobacillus badius]|uniref:trigger factor n=1 Tax=Bacillus badius TaxID=1455 RepID=UPI0005974765|nr:trigger factor [Bacillus badius]KIL75511.1 Cell division trigger factor [Bacillus badius]KZN98657.1 trigger factor [Bacillus badius]KZR58312.1 trigger factor [Bacillus badius]MED0666356.1 trigger factor [Bacillus badius]OCS83598.1 trigger factor [Bacillus badius]
MSAKWEKQEGNQGVLTVEVDAETVSNGLDAAFKKVVKNINVPGFRKGKMPRALFEKRFGVESLYQDALDVILPEAYGKAVEETGIDPVDRPEIDIEQMEKGKELIFKATVTVKPEVKLGEYKGLEAEKLSTEVTDEDVQEELTSLQKRHAELVVKEDGKVEDGDTVVLDFEGSVNGEVFEGGTAENYSLVIGSGTFIPGFEEQLIGMATGEEKDVEVSFPEEYHAEELAGKPAVFKVKLHEIKAQELPELNDDFAKETDEEAETLDELKAQIRTRLEEQKKTAAEQTLRDTLVEKAAANAEIDVPEVMVENEIDRMLQEFTQNLSMQGMNLDLYYQFSGQSEADLRGQMKENAETRVRTSLTLEAIAEAEGLEATEEDTEQELNKMAEQFNLSVEDIKKALGSNLDGMQADLKIRKAVEFLVENSKTSA